MISSSPRHRLIPVRLPAWPVLAAVFLIAGCPNAARETVLTPPLDPFSTDGDEYALVGQSPAKMRHLMSGPLARPVNVRLRGATMDEAISAVSEATGFGLIIDARLWDEAEERTIDLSVRDMKTRHLFEWMARLLGAWCAIEEDRTVIFTNDSNWASRGRLSSQTYQLGALSRIDEPMRRAYEHTYEAQRFLFLLRAVLGQVAVQPSEQIFSDHHLTGITARLNARGHDKLARILEEIRQPHTYRPPEEPAPPPPGAVMAAPVRCNFDRADVREVADRLGRAADVNIGFDYQAVPPDRRAISLALGEVRLDRALSAFAEAAGLGRFHLEPGRRVWIIGRGQDPDTLLDSGILPWDNSIVRSYYVGDLAERFGPFLVMQRVQDAVADGMRVVRPIVFFDTSGEDHRVRRSGRRRTGSPADDAAPPLGFFHECTGRLVLVHSPTAHQFAEHAIERLMAVTRAPEGEED